MKLHVICIGTELLTGRIANTNLQFMAAMLDRDGYLIDREVTVGDDPAAIRGGLAAAETEGAAAITIGGLGPTGDDITRDVIAEHLGVPLEHDARVEAEIRAFLGARARRAGAGDAIRRQALKPRGAQVLRNRRGTAPGLWCAAADRVVIMLPGPPRELQPMFEEAVMPRLDDLLERSVRRRTIKVFGISEPDVDRRVQDVLAATPAITPSFRVGAGRVEVRLSAARNAAATLDAAARRVREVFGADAVPGDRELVELLTEELRRRRWRLAAAESCTGGAIAALITDHAGVSDVFAGGVVAYANAVKHDLLGVRPETLAAHGAVSAETAIEMVLGVGRACGAECAIATTGIAGPGGGTVDKPVGLVYTATCVDGDVRPRRHEFPSDRRGVRARTVYAALNQLRRHLLETDDAARPEADPV